MEPITQAFFLGQISCGIVTLLLSLVVLIISKAVYKMQTKKPNKKEIKSSAGEALKPD